MIGRWRKWIMYAAIALMTTPSHAQGVDPVDVWTVYSKTMVDTFRQAAETGGGPDVPASLSGIAIGSSGVRLGPLDVVSVGYGTIKRAREGNVSPGWALTENVGGLIASKGFSTYMRGSLLHGICASGGCGLLSGSAGATGATGFLATGGALVAIGGIGVDAYLISRVTKEFVGWRREVYLARASQAEAERLQLRLERQRADWPSRRAAQFYEPYSARRTGPVDGKFAPPAAKATAVALKPEPPPGGKYETFKLSPNKWGLNDAVRLVPKLDDTATGSKPKQPAKSAEPQYRPPTHTFGPPARLPSARDERGLSYLRGAAANVRGFGQTYGPGGISLTTAAAERLAFNLDIDSVTVRDGQIVLSGASSTLTSIDAGLFLTAMRLACGDADPSFSLDPVDGAAWSEQTQLALKTVWEKLKGDFSFDDNAGPDAGRNRRIQNGFDIRTISVKRDHPQLWNELRARYPELRAKLVFRPSWVSQTRLGEVLYRADVLLKELTTGVSIVQPAVHLRAAKIDGYVASDQRGAARSLVIPERFRKAEGWRGHRLWFDLMPQTGRDSEAGAGIENPDTHVDRRTHPDLYAEVARRGFVGTRTPRPIEKTVFYSHGDVTDLSQIYPKMFVRRHDHVTGRDISGHDPDLDLLSGDVNERTNVYAGAYQELRDLTDVFRAYIAALKIARQDGRVCGQVRGTPLSKGELVEAPLPDTHPTELTITVARHVWAVNRGRQMLIRSGNSASGGISLRGKEFYPTAIVERQTPIIEEVRRELAGGRPSAPTWKSPSGRQYIAFNLDPREPPPRVPIVATSR